MARPPKPTALLQLQGTYRADRHEKRSREPRAKGTLDAPDWLAPEARAEWDRVVEAYAEAGVVTPLDRAMLATFCQLWARYVEAEQAEPYAPVPISHVVSMANIANRLGLDPSGRVKLPVQEEPDPRPNPWDLPAPTMVSGSS